MIILFNKINNLIINLYNINNDNNNNLINKPMNKFIRIIICFLCKLYICFFKPENF